jgi:hypothetical protein
MWRRSGSEGALVGNRQGPRPDARCRNDQVHLPGPRE